MTPSTAALVAVVAPLGLAIIGVLYRVGTIMGQVKEQMGDHERRIGTLEGYHRDSTFRGNQRR